MNAENKFSDPSDYPSTPRYRPTLKQEVYLRWVILKHQLMTRLNVWDALLFISLIAYMAAPLVKMFGQDVVANSLTLSSSAPAVPTNVGARYSGPFGQTQIFYFVIARFPAGATNPSQVAIANNTQGVQNLSSTATVTVTWSGVSGATGYDVIRSTTSAFPSNPSPGPYAVVINTSSLSVTDNGSALSSYPPSGLVTIQAAQAIQTVNNLTNAVPFVNMTLGGASLRLALIKGSITASDCVQLAADGSGQLESAGAACGSGGGGGFYQTVLNNGSAVTQRNQLNFVPGTGISISNSDSSSPSRTTLTINATGSSTGDVVGPASSTNNSVALFNGTTGKLIKDGGPLPTGDVVGPGSATNNAIALYNGTTGKIIQSSTTLLPTGLLVGTGQANTYTTGLQTFTNARMVIPQGGFFAPALTAEIGWNASISRVVVGNTLGVTQSLAVQGTSSPTANDCVKFDASGFLVTAGAPCASGGTVSAASPYLTIGSSLYGPIFTVTNPGTPAWAWNNQNLATLTTTNNAQTLCAPPSGLSVNSRLVSTPATPWTVTAQFIFNVVNAATPRMGIVLRESGTGKLLTSGAATVSEFYVDNWNSSTSFASTPTTVTLGASAGFKFVRATDNGTNITFSYSYDGIGWHVYYDFSRTNFFTTGPDQFGLFIFNNSAALNVCSTLLSWSVT